MGGLSLLSLLIARFFDKALCEIRESTQRIFNVVSNIAIISDRFGDILCVQICVRIITLKIVDCPVDILKTIQCIRLETFRIRAKVCDFARHREFVFVYQEVFVHASNFWCELPKINLRSPVYPLYATWSIVGTNRPPSYPLKYMRKYDRICIEEYASIVLVFDQLWPRKHGRKRGPFVLCQSR